MKAVTGYELADGAFSDLESFFFHSSKFKIKREMNVQGMRMHASYIGASQNSRIRLSKDFCDFEIDNLKDYFFCLLIVCHELAHYLNYHNSHKDSDEFDSLALEARADNFSGLIFFTLIIFGKNTNRMITNLAGGIEKKKYAQIIGASLRDIHDKIYVPNISDNYPSADHRIMLVICGFMTFFHRYYGVINEDWAVPLISNIAVGAKLNDLIKEDAGNISQAESIDERIRSIHRDLQIKNVFMIDGFKDIFGAILTTNFQQSPNEVAKHRSELRRKISNFSLFNESD